jgi:hypothetical protein
MATTDHKIRLTAVDRTKSAFRSVQMGLRKIGGAVFSFQAALAALGGIAVFSKISKDIDNLGKTASKLGLATSELQALRHAAEISGVETRTLDMAFQRFTRRLAEARAGTGEAKAALEEMGIALSDSEGNARSQVDVLNDVADAMQAVPNQADRVRLAFKLFDSEGAALVNMLQDGSAGLKRLTDDFEQLGMAISKEEVAKVEAFNDAMTRLGALFSNIGQKIGAAVLPRFQELISFLGDKLLGALIAAVKGLQSFFNFAIDGFNSLSEATNGFIGTITGPDFSGAIKKLEDVRSAFRRAVGPQTQIDIKYTNDAVDQTAESVDNATESMKKFVAVQDEQAKLSKIQRSSLRSLEDALVSVADGTATVKDAFKSMAKSIISDLIRIQIRKSITGPLANMMFGAAGGGFSTVPGFTSVGGGGAPSAAMPSFAGGGFTGRGSRSGGVDGKGGFPAILHPNESVVDHSQDQGGGVTVNLNISTGVSQTVRAEIANMMPQIANATKAAVADARMRGGSFSGAMGV